MPYLMIALSIGLFSILIVIAAGLFQFYRYIQKEEEEVSAECIALEIIGSDENPRIRPVFRFEDKGEIKEIKSTESFVSAPCEIQDQKTMYYNRIKGELSFKLHKNMSSFWKILILVLIVFVMFSLISYILLGF